MLQDMGKQIALALVVFVAACGGTPSEIDASIATNEEKTECWADLVPDAEGTPEWKAAGEPPATGAGICGCITDCGDSACGLRPLKNAFCTTDIVLANRLEGGCGDVPKWPVTLCTDWR